MDVFALGTVGIKILLKNYDNVLAVHPKLLDLALGGGLTLLSGP
jgi:hypothetical protein